MALAKKYQKPFLRELDRLTLKTNKKGNQLDSRSKVNANLNSTIVKTKIFFLFRRLAASLGEKPIIDYNSMIEERRRAQIETQREYAKQLDGLFLFV